MKNIYKISIITGIVICSLVIMSFSIYGTVNFLELNLPHNKYDQVDYDKIGYETALDDFIKKLDEKNIQYNSDDLTFIQGISLQSLPPITDYCGYVSADDGSDYWYESTFQKDTLRQNAVTEENPMPCKPNMGSCICSLETKLAEKNTTTLSYFNSPEQKFVEDIVQKYLGSINIASGPEKFVIGKYNHQFEKDDIAFCGAFVSELIENPDPEKVLRENVTKIRNMQGTIRNQTQVLGFSISVDSENLCAINENATVIHFKRINRNE